MEGKVRVDGNVERKPSRTVAEESSIEVAAPPRFVSRGGEKLEGAFNAFGLSAEGKTCLDVGASTGGFTDCLLQHGAARVMAIDVGTNQLAYSLRVDPRVWTKENFNARYMTAADLPWTPSLAVTDVSFISLKLILPPIASVLEPGGEIVALIKPQFEVGKGMAPGGLVRDEELRIAARDEIVRFGKEELSLELLGLEESPIRGKEMGNIEYLSFWRKPALFGNEQSGVLLHACCGPCASACVPRLKESGKKVTLFYSNSNIDTEEEFEKRKREVEKLAAADGVDVVFDRYDHEDWLEKVARGYENEPEKGRRCARCYAYNLRKTSEYAAKHGFGSYSTTLTVSPHKPTEMVFAAAENFGGPVFLREDFKKRDGFAKSLKRADELGMYRQNYCGCEFSKHGL